MMTLNKKTLLIDCGNTFLKWCLSDGETLSEQQNIRHRDQSILEIFKELLEDQSSSCDSVVLVSVLGEVFSAGANKISEDTGLHFFEVHSQDDFPEISNAYDKPEKLGNDRWVAMIGALELKQAAEACIVIDSGTATTIDAIDETGKHLGGVILPGLELSLGSLSTNTELLPDLQTNDLLIDENGFAKNTNQAISSGCLLGLTGSIDSICNKMQRQLTCINKELTSSQVRKIICGGGAKLLLPHLENEYEHQDNLIMLGLKRIKKNNIP